MSDVTLTDGESGPVLSNGTVTIAVHLNKGAFSLLDHQAERPVIADAGVAIVLSAGPALSSRGAGWESEGTSPIDDALGRGLSLRLRRENDEHEPELLLTISLYEDHPFAVVQVEMVNRGPAKVPVAAFHVLDGARIDLGSPVAGWRFYKHGWQSWSPTLVLECSGEDIPMAAPVIAPGTQPEFRAGRFVSETITGVVSAESGRGLVAGFITTADQLSQLWLDRDSKALTAASYADGMRVPPAGRLASERLLLEPSAAPLEAMERYGDALARAMGAAPSAPVATGWCSWYHFWQGVREEQVVANLDELARRRDTLPLEYIQVDDGWQVDLGDWLDVNEKFPHGLKWLVDRIHADGFGAGLWLAPFLMGANSRLYREHPDWAVEYKPGKPFIAMRNWGQDCYAIDLTRPEVIEWLGAVFRTVSGDWGFDYVKIDFIYAAAVDGIRHDPDMTRAQAYRRGLEVVRKAVGDRFVLACGNPIGPSIGLVDGARIGPDVAPYWLPAGATAETARNRMNEPSCLNAIRNSITRWWMHGRLWQSDPDCLLARDSETALTPDEVRSLATVIALSGGMVLDSDDLTRLTPQRREIISLLLPPSGAAARPLDLFGGEMPGLLELDCGSHRLLAAFNWSDHAKTVEAPLGTDAVRVFDAWDEEDLGERQGSMAVGVPAHGCRLLALGAGAAAPEADSRRLPRLFRLPED